jgi:hypothetical protein
MPVPAESSFAHVFGERVPPENSLMAFRATTGDCHLAAIASMHFSISVMEVSFCLGLRLSCLKDTAGHLECPDMEGTSFGRVSDIREGQ